MKHLLKRLARMIAWVAVSPAFVSFAVRKRMFSADRALEGSTQALALWPGIVGQYLRRAFLSRTLRHCAPSVTIEYGTIFSQTGARLDENVYIGPRCQLGLAHIERNVLIAGGVHVPSGRHIHGIDRAGVPIREQGQLRLPVRIGAGSWIGANAVVMASVGADTIVGAGAVVTRPLPDGVVAVGVPARVLRVRQTGRQISHQNPVVITESAEAAADVWETSRTVK